jgi:hypothetical protein
MEFNRLDQQENQTHTTETVLAMPPIDVEDQGQSFISLALYFLTEFIL